MSYTPALCVLNLVLLVSSTACLYLGSILVNIYLLPYLYLVSSNFATVPYLILGIGGLLLLVSIFGIVAALSNSRPALVVYAALLGDVPDARGTQFSGIVNGSLRSLRSQYSQLQEQPISKEGTQRSSLYIEPSNEAGTVI